MWGFRRLTDMARRSYKIICVCNEVYMSLLTAINVGMSSAFRNWFNVHLVTWPSFVRHKNCETLFKVIIWEPDKHVWNVRTVEKKCLFVDFGNGRCEGVGVIWKWQGHKFSQVGYSTGERNTTHLRHLTKPDLADLELFGCVEINLMLLSLLVPVRSGQLTISFIWLNKKHWYA